MFHTVNHIKPDIPADGDPIALAIVLGVLALFALWVIVDKRRKKKAAPAEVTADVPAAEAPKAPGSAGKVMTFDVPDKTAALLMAIAAEKTGRPLNELRFVSIKEVKE